MALGELGCCSLSLLSVGLLSLVSSHLDIFWAGIELIS